MRVKFSSEGYAQREAEAARLIAWAIFNLGKGKTAATETLLKKAFKELTGLEWDGN